MPPPANNRRSYSTHLMLKKFLILVLITTIHSALLAQTATPTPQKTHYTCVMHPEVMQDHPGKCPKSGMELMPLTKERERRTPKIEHRTSNERLSHAMHDDEHHDHMMHEMKMQSSVNLTDP